jgi:hypothetical protein
VNAWGTGAGLYLGSPAGRGSFPKVSALLFLV